MTPTMVGTFEVEVDDRSAAGIDVTGREDGDNEFDDGVVVGV